LAEQCSAQADATQPGPEREALLAKARQYRSYAKMENWIASKELQAPVSELRNRAKKIRSATTLRIFSTCCKFSNKREAKPEPVQPARVAQ
jgi:hypothetical protein